MTFALALAFLASVPVGLFMLLIWAAYDPDYGWDRREADADATLRWQLAHGGKP